MKSESAILNETRLRLSELGHTNFRINVGQAWTGAKIERLHDGSIVIYEPRPFKTGVPTGFSDLFGILSVEITPEMVGQTVGIFYALEVKSSKGRVSIEQQNFLDFVQKQGGISGIIRTPDDINNILIMKGKL